MRTRHSWLLISAAMLSTTAVFAQTVPGFDVSVYATVDEPMKMTFAPDGTMFVGRQVSDSLAPCRIHSIGIGGTPVVEYGDAPIPDPDSVAYDTAGQVSGTPGSVIVGGWDGSDGRLSVIAPDQTVSILMAPTSLHDPDDIVFDALGRLLTIGARGDVYAIERNGSLTETLLFSSPPDAGQIATSGTNIVTTHDDGTIRVHDLNGDPVGDGILYSGLTPGKCASIAIGALDPEWGTEVYALDRLSGDLLRISLDGTATLIGYGFVPETGLPGDIAFGPDGALYTSFRGDDLVIRIVPEPSVALLLLATLSSRRHR